MYIALPQRTAKHPGNRARPRGTPSWSRGCALMSARVGPRQRALHLQPEQGASRARENHGGDRRLMGGAIHTLHASHCTRSALVRRRRAIHEVEEPTPGETPPRRVIAFSEYATCVTASTCSGGRLVMRCKTTRRRRRRCSVFISTVSEEQASPELREVYEAGRAQFGFIPNYARAFSHRPAVYRAWTNLISAITSNLDRRLYEIATVAAARAQRSSYCTLAHGRALMRNHMTDDELLALVEGGDAAGLSPL